MVQFDPVNLVGTSPCITINARVQGFKPRMLDDLLYKDRLLWDHWDRCASIVLREDLAPLQRNRGDTNWRPRSRRDTPQEAFDVVIRRFEAEKRPLTTTDFKDIDEREALMLLYAAGSLQIHHREGPRRFFGLASAENRELFTDSSYFGSEEEFFAWMFCRRIGSSGLLAGLSSIGLHAIRGLTPEAKKKTQSDLLREGKIAELRIEGLRTPYYCLSEDLPLLQDEKGVRPPVPKACFLAPLDNLMWDRRVIRELFDFNYGWEIYTPVEKRLYDSYTLPVLYGDRLIARTQLQAKDGLLSISGWWWEPQVKPTKAILRAVIAALKAHACMLDLDAVWDEERLLVSL